MKNLKTNTIYNMSVKSFEYWLNYVTNENNGSFINESIDNKEELLKSIENYCVPLVKKLEDKYENYKYILRKIKDGFAIVQQFYYYTDTKIKFKINNDNYIIKLNKNAIESGDSFEFKDWKNAINFAFDYIDAKKNLLSIDDNDDDDDDKYKRDYTNMFNKLKNKYNLI